MGPTQTWNSQGMPLPMSIHNQLWETYEGSVGDMNGRKMENFIIEKHKKTLLLLLLKLYLEKVNLQEICSLAKTNLPLDLLGYEK